MAVVKQVIQAVFTNVGTSFTLQEIENQPARYQIKEVTADILSGSGTEIALKILRSGTDIDLYTKLEYGLTALPFMWQEDIQFKTLKADPKNVGRGSTWIAVATDVGSDTEIRVLIDIETER